MNGLQQMSFEEVTAIVLALVTLLDKSNPEAKIHEQVAIMAEAIYEQIILENRPDGTQETAGETSNGSESDGAS